MTASGGPTTLDTASRLRDFVLWLFVAGTAATAIDLVLLGHFDDARQWAPLFVLPASLVVTAWHRLRPGYLGTRVFQAAMVLSIAIGGVGLWFHYRGNMDFELDVHPSIAGWALLREAVSGATPALAPAVMMQLGLLGLIYTYRHPFLERKSSLDAIGAGSQRRGEIVERVHYPPPG